VRVLGRFDRWLVAASGVRRARRVAVGVAYGGRVDGFGPWLARGRRIRSRGNRGLHAGRSLRATRRPRQLQAGLRHATKKGDFMKHLGVVLLAIFALGGCKRQESLSPGTARPTLQAGQSKSGSLAAARQGFKTKLTRQESAGVPVPVPPPDLFQIVD